MKGSSVWHYLMLFEPQVSKLCSLCLKVVNVRQIRCPLLSIGRSLVSTKCHFLWHVIENMFDIMIKKRHFNFKYDCVILRQEGKLSRFDFIWQAPSNVEQVKKGSLLYWNKNCAIGNWFICYKLHCKKYLGELPRFTKKKVGIYWSLSNFYYFWSEGDPPTLQK